MTVIEPLLFEPILKHRAWGGDRLRHFGKRVPMGGRIGESWELADLPDEIQDGRSHVACGAWSGMTLREIISAHPNELLGSAERSKEGGFPLLVKYLDAHEHLSVQVHPDAAYAAAVPGAHLKTEAWVILEAQAGAMIYRGVRRGVTREQFFDDLRDVDGAGVLPHLVAVPVERGDCIYLPSGICHALGAGIVAAEVQTPSDTTFRVFDWNRHDPGRRLHVDEARQCMRFGDAQEDGVPGIVRHTDACKRPAPGLAVRTLCATPVFVIEWIDAMPATQLPIMPSGSPVIWSVVEGSAELRGPDGRALRLRIGDTALMPAALDGWTGRFADRSTILRTSIPSAPRPLAAR